MSSNNVMSQTGYPGKKKWTRRRRRKALIIVLVTIAVLTVAGAYINNYVDKLRENAALHNLGEISPVKMAMAENGSFDIYSYGGSNASFIKTDSESVLIGTAANEEALGEIKKLSNGSLDVFISRDGKTLSPSSGLKAEKTAGTGTDLPGTSVTGANAVISYVGTSDQDGQNNNFLVRVSYKEASAVFIDAMSDNEAKSLLGHMGTAKYLVIANTEPSDNVITLINEIEPSYVVITNERYAEDMKSALTFKTVILKDKESVHIDLADDVFEFRPAPEEAPAE